MVFTLYIVSTAYITYLNGYGGVYRLEKRLEDRELRFTTKELEYNILESEYESCLDYIRTLEQNGIQTE